jgi:hypothetical protein
VRRLSVRALVLALVIAAFPSAVVLASTGTVGRWSLIDTDRYPGATCVYHTTPDDEVHQIRIRAPVIYAIDATSGVDTQTVGWRWIVQYSTDLGATWHLEQRGPIVKAAATDRYNAQWPKLVGTWDRGTTALHGVYRAVVSMIWFTPGGGVQGRTNAIVAHYIEFYDGKFHAAENACATTLG